MQQVQIAIKMFYQFINNLKYQLCIVQQQIQSEGKDLK